MSEIYLCGKEGVYVGGKITLPLKYICVATRIARRAVK